MSVFILGLFDVPYMMDSMVRNGTSEDMAKALWVRWWSFMYRLRAVRMLYIVGSAGLFVVFIFMSLPHLLIIGTGDGLMEFLSRITEPFQIPILDFLCEDDDDTSSAGND